MARNDDRRPASAARRGGAAALAAMVPVVIPVIVLVSVAASSSPPGGRPAAASAVPGPEGGAETAAPPVFAGVSRGGLHASALPGQGDLLARDGVDALAENRKPGAGGWLIGDHGGDTLIEGFADAVSVRAGEPLGLHVSATAPTFRVEVLRTGDYDGRWARRVWVSPDLPGTVRGGRTADPATRMVSASWPRSATLDTTGWLPGAYLAKLVGADGAASFVPFVVRDTTSRGAVLLVQGVATWQAYNPWGGPSTYRGYQTADKAEDVELRATAASFDRPYARGSGAGGFLTDELPAVALAERLGLNLNYAADLDLQLHPEVLDGAVAIVVLGHSEYWSRQMRANLTAARDRGANLAFLGANDVHRRIRLTDSPLGAGRVMVNYKLGEDDPVADRDTTADWGRAPFPNPQSALIGPMFACAHASGDLVVTDPQAWPFAGLGLAVGTRLAGLVGPEYDRVDLRVSTPRPLQVLAHSPMKCRGRPDASDMTWYSHAAGGGVFAAGTLGWVPALVAADPLTARVVTAVTERVLRAVARPQAGARIPARDNVADYYTPDGALPGVGPGTDGGPDPTGPDLDVPDIDPQADPTPERTGL